MQSAPSHDPGSFLYSTVPALKRLSLGLVYLVGHTLLSPHITEDYLVSEDYEVSSTGWVPTSSGLVRTL